jgi:hypothetical protein
MSAQRRQARPRPAQLRAASQARASCPGDDWPGRIASAPTEAEAGRGGLGVPRRPGR